jgi:hypothetical protein
MNGTRPDERLMSKSTISDRSSAITSYIACTTAGVLTVASTIEWNVRMGGSFAPSPAAAARAICRCSVVVNRHVCSPAFAAKELYLNGLYSG